MLTAQEYQEKHARNLKNSTTDIINGVQKVSTAPTLEAAKKKNKMLQNLTQAVNDGSWENGLKKVSLEDWKKKTVEVGVGRISAGIDAAANKVLDFATQFLPYVENVASQVRNMPDLTLSDSIARMTKQVTETAKFKMK